LAGNEGVTKGGAMSERKDFRTPSSEPAPIPGDPFPWEPDAPAVPEPPASESREVRSPAQPGDPDSFDLGGGD